MTTLSSGKLSPWRTWLGCGEGFVLEPVFPCAPFLNLWLHLNFREGFGAEGGSLSSPAASSASGGQAPQPSLAWMHLRDLVHLLNADWKPQSSSAELGTSSGFSYYYGHLSLSLVFLGTTWRMKLSHVTMICYGTTFAGAATSGWEACLSGTKGGGVSYFCSCCKEQNFLLAADYLPMFSPSNPPVWGQDVAIQHCGLAAGAIATMLTTEQTKQLWKP